MGAKEKPLHTNSIICLTLKGSGSISTSKAVIFITFKEKQMVPHKKMAIVEILFFSAFLEAAAYHSGYLKERCLMISFLPS